MMTWAGDAAHSSSSKLWLFERVVNLGAHVDVVVLEGVAKVLRFQELGSEGVVGLEARSFYALPQAMRRADT